MKDALLNVLILEDDIAWKAIYKNILNDFDNLLTNFDLTDKVEEAKKLIETNNYDLFIFDYCLKDGTSLCLLEHPKVDPKRVVLITGYEEEFLKDAFIKIKGVFLFRKNNDNFYKTLERFINNAYQTKNDLTSCLMDDEEFKDTLTESEKIHLTVINKMDLLENCIKNGNC